MRQRTRRLRVEQLEQRAMLSVSASVVTGDTLAVIGDSATNTIRVTQDTAAAAWTVVGDSVNLGSFSNIRNITINPKVGPDVVAVQGTQLPGSLTITGGLMQVTASVSGVLGTSQRAATPLTIGGTLMITGGAGPDVVQLRSVAAKSVLVALGSSNDQLYVTSTGNDANGVQVPGLNAEAVGFLMGGGDDVVSIGAALNATARCRVDGGSNTSASPGATLNGSANIHGPAAENWTGFETLGSPTVLARSLAARPAWMRS